MHTLPIVQELFEIATTIPSEKLERLNFITLLWRPQYRTFDGLVTAIADNNEHFEFTQFSLEYAATYITSQTKNEVSVLEAMKFFLTLGLAVVVRLDTRIRKLSPASRL